MFKREEKLKTDSVIGKESEFKGSLKDKESIRIDGSFEGEIEVGGNLIVGEDAVIKANIKSKSISIGGKVVGDVNCQGRVELFSSGSLEGKVKASDLTIAEGAFFNGECRMVPLGEFAKKESFKPQEKSKSEGSLEK